MARTQKRARKSSPAQNSNLPEAKVKKKKNSGKYSIPDNATIGSNGSLNIPRPASPSKMSTASSVSSLAGSLLNLKTANLSGQNPQKTQQTQDLLGKGRPNKIKPIETDANYKIINRILEDMKLLVKPLMKIIDNREASAKTRIICRNEDDKIAVLAELKHRQIFHHTHREPGKRTKLFVLKNYIREELTEMKRILDETGVSSTKVSFLVDHPERPVYLVHTEDDSININVLQHHYKAIKSLIVTWQRFNLSLKRPSPCRNCKQWGHAASSCGRPYRCGKCADKHKPGECTRTDRTPHRRCSRSCPL